MSSERDQATNLIGVRNVRRLRAEAEKRETRRKRQSGWQPDEEEADIEDVNLLDSEEDDNWRQYLNNSGASV
jgi:PAB1-binding protein PBP1